MSAGVVADDAAHVTGRGRVKALGGLVEKQDSGIVHQRSRDEQTLLHAAGIRPDLAGCGVRQADALEKLRDASRWRAVELGEQLQVLTPGLTLIQILLLEHEIDERFHTFALVHDVATGDECAPACWTRPPRQHADGRGLAGAVVAEEAQDLALGHAEADIIDRTHITVVLGEPLHLDDGAAGAVSTHSRSNRLNHVAQLP